MSYLPKYDYEIFVSYAHADNVGSVPWILRFVEDLKRSLERRMGIPGGLRIFFDERALQGNEQLESLKINAQRSALFLAFTSPSYVARSWPLDELGAFCSTLDISNRIFAVENLPLDNEDDYPAALRNRNRTHFWVRSTESDVAITIDPVKPEPSAVLFQLKIDGFAENLRTKLRALKIATGSEQPAVRIESGSLTNAPKNTVLLGQVTSDLETERERVKSYLEQFGIGVLPSGTYPQGGREFSTAFEADCAKAATYVQLLGPLSERRPPDLPEGYACFQYAAAKQRGLNVILWRRPDLTTEIIESHRDKQLFSAPELRSSGLEEVKADIVRLLKLPLLPPRPKANNIVFIDSDQTDLDFARNLGEKIMRGNIRTTLPVFRGCAEEIHRDLEDSIVECSALVVVYGKAQPTWVRAQLRFINKVRGRTPPKLLAIYTGPPADPNELGIMAPDVTWIDVRTVNDNDAADKIMAALNS